MLLLKVMYMWGVKNAYLIYFDQKLLKK
jgi:hypothetical protein